MKWLKKLYKKIRGLLLMSYYTLFYYKHNLKENWILIDSKNGKDLGSNLLRIAEELAHNPEYKEYKIYISCNKNKKEEIRMMISKYHLTGVKLIRENGFRHAKVLGMAKYLFTDTSFALWYVKKEGQIVTNTWHGTPLKMMGKDVGNRCYDIGNVQRNYMFSDYLLYPSDYMKDIMVSAYFLDNLYQGKILCSGYPRNSVFFDIDKRKVLREELGVQEKKLYGYMPTWRGTLKNIDSKKITNQLEYYFVYLDEKLNDDEIFFVRLHPFVANNIDYSVYKHIKPFPEGYEPYDILNICDCMVTDYSSVLFDYVNSGQKIILFVYDREYFMDERGTYVSLDSFPFPQVRSVKKLLDEMRTPKQYDDTAFRKKYCQYDTKDVAAKLCKHIIKGEKVYEEYSVQQNNKENVLIYTGNLAKNGFTTALLNLLASIDKDKRNYFVTFRSASLKKTPNKVALFPEGIGIVPISSMHNETLLEKRAISKFFNKNKTSPSVMRKVDRFYKRLYQRHFGHCQFDHVIHYSGYEKEVINLFQQADANRMIFVHSDMVKELESKNNQHEPTLRRAYHDFERVIPVTMGMYEPTLQLGENKENLYVVNNCHAYWEVLEKAQKEISFEPETLSNVFVDELKEILNSDAKKFITIGRFSAEKNHDLLLKAFDKYHSENPDSYLIIIGGYGTLYGRTVARASNLSAAKNIIIIRTIENPMPILAKCDLFILSSSYEALGLTLLEADTLNVPVISTNIEGPRAFMEKNGGYMVSTDVEGLYEGMKAFDRGEVKAMNVDYEEYNARSVEEFEKLFEGDK